MGDPDWDGVLDAQVGARADDDGASNSGAVYTLYMNSDGIVKTVEKTSSTQGGLSGVLGNGDNFGSSVAFVGDLDGDGIFDALVGARNDDDGGADQGAVYVLFMGTTPQSTITSAFVRKHLRADV